jgi:hypothetical protein
LNFGDKVESFGRVSKYGIDSGADAFRFQAKALGFLREAQVELSDPWGVGRGGLSDFDVDGGILDRIALGIQSLPEVEQRARCRVQRAIGIDSDDVIMSICNSPPRLSAGPNRL